MTTGALFTASGYLVGILVLCWEARRRQLDTEGMGYAALAGLCGGVLGAKVVQWSLVSWPLFSRHPGLALDPSSGGRTIIGGILGGWLAVEVAKRLMGIRRSTGDLFALALPAGEFLGRIGCFFNGCCYGVTCHLPWAVYQHDAWRHPAQLYSSLAALAIFIVLFHLRDRMVREGDLFRLYIVLYGASRFLIEFVRSRDILFGGLSLAQWVCLEGIVACSAALAFSSYRASRKETARMKKG